MGNPAYAEDVRDKRDLKDRRDVAGWRYPMRKWTWYQLIQSPLLYLRNQRKGLWMYNQLLEPHHVLIAQIRQKDSCFVALVLLSLYRRIGLSLDSFVYNLCCKVTTFIITMQQLNNKTRSYPHAPPLILVYWRVGCWWQFTEGRCNMAEHVAILRL